MITEELAAAIGELRASVAHGLRPNNPQVTMVCEEAERLAARVAELERSERRTTRAIMELSDGLQVDDRYDPCITLVACFVQVGIIHRENDDLRGELAIFRRHAKAIDWVRRALRWIRSRWSRGRHG